MLLLRTWLHAPHPATHRIIPVILPRRALSPDFFSDETPRVLANIPSTRAAHPPTQRHKSDSPCTEKPSSGTSLLVRGPETVLTPVLTSSFMRILLACAPSKLFTRKMHCLGNLAHLSDYAQNQTSAASSATLVSADSILLHCPVTGPSDDNQGIHHY